MKIPKIQSVAFVSIPIIMKDDFGAYEIFCEIVHDDFTWGDTEYALVSKQQLSYVLSRAIKASLYSPGDKTREKIAQGLLDFINECPDGIMFSL